MKLKKILAAALAAAMVVSNISAGGYGISNVMAEEQESSNLIQKKEIREVDVEILKANAKANSEQNPTTTKGGPATYAFDGEEHWWHSRFSGNPGSGEVASGLVNENNPIWIQTGFGGETKQIKKLTYKARTDNKGGVINKYKVMVANQPDGTVEDGDFQTVKEGNLANNMNEQTILLDQAVAATHIRLVAYSVHPKADTQNYVSARRIHVYEEVELDGQYYDTNKEQDYWDYEKYNGTLAQQTDNDVWYYQIKTNDGWINLPADAFHGDVWMCQNSEDPTYYWAKLGKSNITSTFRTNSNQKALAFTWKAQEAGYYRAKLEGTITGSDEAAKRLDCRVWYATAGSTEDGKILHQGILNNGGTFTSKIAKVNAGDLIRIGAVTKNAWAQNFFPMVEKVSAKDYAVQYLAEVENVEDGNYATSSKQAVVTARDELRAATQAAEPDMADIAAKITALETAIAGLKPAVASVTLNKNELALTVGQTEQLTVTVGPEGTDTEVLWESDNKEAAVVEQNGTVTAKKAGNAVITVTSTDNPEKFATCTVVVSRDDTALDAAIERAETKKAEENYVENYTEGSRKALEDALKIAKQVKENTTISEEEVKLAVDNLNDAVDGLVAMVEVTVVNKDTTETKKYEPGKNVKVDAAAAGEGMKFSHWEVNGTPVCYLESYTFIVSVPMTVTAVYVEVEKPIEKQASVLLNMSYENGKVKFLSKHTVPADQEYKVIKSGLVITDQTGYDAIIAAKEDLSLDVKSTNRIQKPSTNTSYYIFNYSFAIKSTRKTTWYAKGYVTYMDSEGNEHTVYSDMKSVEVQ